MPGPASHHCIIRSTSFSSAGLGSDVQAVRRERLSRAGIYSPSGIERVARHPSLVEINTAVHRFPQITRILTESSSPHLGSVPKPASERVFLNSTPVGFETSGLRGSVLSPERCRDSGVGRDIPRAGNPQ